MLLVLCGVLFCAGCKTSGKSIQVVKLQHSIVQEVWEHGTPQSSAFGYTKGGPFTVYCQITLYIDGRFVRQDTNVQGWGLYDAYYRGTWRIDSETGERILVDTEGNVSRLDPSAKPEEIALVSRPQIHGYWGSDLKRLYARPVPRNPFQDREPSVDESE